MRSARRLLDAALMAAVAAAVGGGMALLIMAIAQVHGRLE
jgi:hypothetical protein